MRELLLALLLLFLLPLSALAQPGGAYPVTGDRCYGRACRVKTLTTTAPSGTVAVTLPGTSKLALNGVNLWGDNSNYLNIGSGGYGVAIGSSGAVLGEIISGASSGNPAFRCSTVGCRLSLGDTGRYLRDTGSVWELSSALQPSGSATQNLGSAANRWLYVFGYGWKDGTDAIRGVWGNGSSSNDYRGTMVDGATSIGHIFRTPTLSTAGARLARFDRDGSNTEAFSIYHDGMFRSTGVATASLQACAAGVTGSIQYDTTTNTLKVCNGTSWGELNPATGLARYVSRSVRATQSEATALVNGAYTAIAWNTELFDTDTLHDNATFNSRLTASITGKWSVACGVQTNNADSTASAILLRKGSGQEIATNSVAFEDLGGTATTLIDLAAGEQVTCLYYVNAAGITTNASARNFFAMHYVGD